MLQEDQNCFQLTFDGLNLTQHQMKDILHVEDDCTQGYSYNVQYKSSHKRKEHL